MDSHNPECNTVYNFESRASPHYGYIACSIMYHFATSFWFSMLYDYVNMYDQSVVVKFGFGYALMNLQYALISEIIDWTASDVFKGIPYLNAAKRPQLKRPGRVEGYSVYYSCLQRCGLTSSCAMKRQLIIYAPAFPVMQQHPQIRVARRLLFTGYIICG